MPELIAFLIIVPALTIIGLSVLHRVKEGRWPWTRDDATGSDDNEATGGGGRPGADKH